MNHCQPGAQYLFSSNYLVTYVLFFPNASFFFIRMTLQASREVLSSHCSMIDSEYRFIALSGAVTPGGPSTWHITDWDQRRLISVTMDGELDSEEPAIEHLKRHVESLADDVVEIEVSPQGNLLRTFADPERDESFCLSHPALATLELPGHVQVVPRSNLEELDRLGPMVDLVKERSLSEPAKKVRCC